MAFLNERVCKRIITLEEHFLLGLLFQFYRKLEHTELFRFFHLRNAIKTRANESS